MLHTIVALMFRLSHSFCPHCYGFSFINFSPVSSLALSLPLPLLLLQLLFFSELWGKLFLLFERVCKKFDHTRSRLLSFRYVTLVHCIHPRCMRVTHTHTQKHTNAQTIVKLPSFEHRHSIKSTDSVDANLFLSLSLGRVTFILFITSFRKTFL